MKSFDLIYLYYTNRTSILRKRRVYLVQLLLQLQYFFFKVIKKIFLLKGVLLYSGITLILSQSIILIQQRIYLYLFFLIQFQSLKKARILLTQYITPQLLKIILVEVGIRITIYSIVILLIGLIRSADLVGAILIGNKLSIVESN